MYKSILKPLMFLLDPEKAHHLTVNIFKFSLKVPLVSSLLKQQFGAKSYSLEKEVFGLKFKNPVGLAAGFDKDGKYHQEMSKVGFGFIEIGTVTPLPQIGNEKPRLFRLPKDGALINRMGFNNDGVDAMVERLKNYRPKDVILGGNIGKNKVTPNERAIDDYVICFTKLHDYVDYFVVNVSSPNTPGLRALQEKKPLTEILSKLMTLNSDYQSPKPILLKIAPDLTNEQLDDIVDIVQETGIDGVIATNTTIDRTGLTTTSSDIEHIGAGGLSGSPLQTRSTEVIKYLHAQSKGSFPIVGVGGIDSPQSASEKMEAGATLIQIYSGMIYYGPQLVRDICKMLAKKQSPT